MKYYVNPLHHYKLMFMCGFLFQCCSAQFKTLLKDKGVYVWIWQEFRCTTKVKKKKINYLLTYFAFKRYPVLQGRGYWYKTVTMHLILSTYGSEYSNTIELMQNPTYYTCF